MVKIRAFLSSAKSFVLHKLGRYEEALTACERAITLNPDNPGTWHNKGAIFFGLGRHDEGLVAYEQAITLKPDYRDAWAGKGIALENLGRYEESLAAFEQATTLKPDFQGAELWCMKGSVLTHLCHSNE